MDSGATYGVLTGGSSSLVRCRLIIIITGEANHWHTRSIAAANQERATQSKHTDQTLSNHHHYTFTRSTSLQLHPSTFLRLSSFPALIANHSYPVSFYSSRAKRPRFNPLLSVHLPGSLTLIILHRRAETTPLDPEDPEVEHIQRYSPINKITIAPLGNNVGQVST